MAEPRRTGTIACLRRAGATVREDPVGILLPAAGILLLQLAAITVIRALWFDATLPVVRAAIGLVLLRVLGGTLLRARLIAVGARAAGMRSAPWGRPVALLGVELVVGVLVVIVAAVVGLPILAISAAIAAQGWYTTGAVTFATGVGLATGAALLVRAVFALAPAGVTVEGSSALRALVQSVGRAPREIGPLVTLVVAGDLLVAVGGLLCGAGALPGYPISDLAMLHRWREERGSP